MKQFKQISLLCLLWLVGMNASAEIVGGDCGLNVKWSLDTETGVLVISGEGVMKDYYKTNPAPFSEYSSYIHSVQIGEGVTSIGGSAFRDCSGLTSITIPNSVTSIKSSAFEGCTELTSITIPNSVTSIGGSAFSDCSSLTSITIPNSVTSIGSLAFYRCTGLTSITIPNSVTNIGESAFGNCTSLTEITIPNSVTNIGESAFVNCTSLTEITIPNSVTNIGDYAFSGCSSLMSITIPNSVISIGSHAFHGCYLSIDHFINNSYLDPISNKYWWANIADIEQSDGLLIKDKIAIFCRKTAKVVSIPNFVTSIEYRAFSDCTGLTSITIPNSVTSIGGSAFYGCTGLTNITIPNSVTSIESWAFYRCTGLTDITIPNSATIGAECFYGCSKDLKVTINVINWSNTNNIVNSTVWGNSSYSINTNKPFTYTFNGKEVSGNYSIPDTVKSIGENALVGCKDITALEIPASVENIGSRAFAYCSNLSSIKIHNSRPLAIYRVFDGVDTDNCILYVPKGTSSMYMSAPEWINFKHIQEFSDDGEIHFITIKQAESGVVKQVAELGKTYQYLFEPAEGWELNTVTFNGNDVTWMLSNGLFTTPAITGDVELSVVFRQKGNDVKAATASNIKVQASAGTVTISGADLNAPVSIYTTSGMLVKSAKGNATLSLDSDGVYIIKVGEETFKVRM